MFTGTQEGTSCAPAEDSQPDLCTCRVCGGQMEAKFQPALLPGRAGYWYLTCWNPCALNGYTFTNNTYPTVNLTPYLTKD